MIKVLALCFVCLSVAANDFPFLQTIFGGVEAERMVYESDMMMDIIDGKHDDSKTNSPAEEILDKIHQQYEEVLKIKNESITVFNKIKNTALISGNVVKMADLDFLNIVDQKNESDESLNTGNKKLQARKLPNTNGEDLSNSNCESITDRNKKCFDDNDFEKMFLKAMYYISIDRFRLNEDDERQIANLKDIKFSVTPSVLLSGLSSSRSAQMSLIAEHQITLLRSYSIFSVEKDPTIGKPEEDERRKRGQWESLKDLDTVEDKEKGFGDKLLGGMSSFWDSIKTPWTYSKSNSNKKDFRNQIEGLGGINAASKLNGLVPQNYIKDKKYLTSGEKAKQDLSNIKDEFGGNDKTARYLMSELIIVLFECAYRLAAKKIKPELCVGDEFKGESNKSILLASLEDFAQKLITLSADETKLKNSFEYYSADFKKAHEYIVRLIKDDNSIFHEFLNQSSKIFCIINPITSLGFDENFIYFRYILSEIEMLINQQMEESEKNSKQEASKVGEDKQEENDKKVSDPSNNKLNDLDKKLATAVDTLLYNVIIYSNEKKFHRLLIDLYEEFFEDLETYITKGLVTNPTFFSKCLEVIEFHFAKVGMILDSNVLRWSLKYYDFVEKNLDKQTFEKQHAFVTKGFDEQVFEKIHAFLNERVDNAVRGNKSTAENLSELFKKYHGDVKSNIFSNWWHDDDDELAFKGIFKGLDFNEIFATTLQDKNKKENTHDEEVTSQRIKCAEAVMHYYYSKSYMVIFGNVHVQKALLMNYRCIYDPLLIDYKLFKVTAQYMYTFKGWDSWMPKTDDPKNMFKNKREMIMPYFRDIITNLFEFFFFAKYESSHKGKYGVANFNEFMDKQIKTALEKPEQSKTQKLNMKNTATQTDPNETNNQSQLEKKNEREGVNFHHRFEILLSFWFLGFASFEIGRESTNLLDGPVLKLQYFIGMSGTNTNLQGIIEAFKNLDLFIMIEKKIAELYQKWFEELHTRIQNALLSNNNSPKKARSAKLVKQACDSGRRSLRFQPSFHFNQNLKDDLEKLKSLIEEVKVLMSKPDTFGMMFKNLTSEPKELVDMHFSRLNAIGQFLASLNDNERKIIKDLIHDKRRKLKMQRSSLSKKTD
jgi:hypothetical protein